MSTESSRAAPDLDVFVGTWRIEASPAPAGGGRRAETSTAPGFSFDLTSRRVPS